MKIRSLFNDERQIIRAAQKNEPLAQEQLFEADKRAQHPIGIGWRLNLD